MPLKNLKQSQGSDGSTHFRKLSSGSTGDELEAGLRRQSNKVGRMGKEAV